jgi:segregation and condensation protein A
MAAALIQIKSRMLIPGGGGEGGEGEEDPRMAIVRPLAEYALIREMAGALDERWVLGRDVFPRGDSDDFRDSELAPEGEPTLKISLFELSETWRSLCSRPIPDDRGLSFRLETATIGERLADIRRFLLAVRAAHFSELKTERGTALETSLSLLAVLELAKTGFLQVWQRTEDDMTGPRIFLGDPDAVADPDPDYK